MATGEQLSFKICLPPDLHPGVGLQGHLMLLCLVFKRTSLLFPIANVPIYIPTTVGGFTSSNTPCSIYCFKFFEVAILTGVRWYLVQLLICLSLREALSFPLPMWLSGKEHTSQCRRGWFSTGSGDSLKEMATHSSILAWKIPWREEPGGLQSMRW